MKERLLRMSGYAVAALIGAALSSVHVLGDDPLSKGAIIAGKRALPMMASGICLGSDPNCVSALNSGDVSALYAVNSYQRLAKLDDIITALETLHTDNTNLNMLLKNQIATFNGNMQKSLAQRLDAYPAELLKTKAMQTFHDKIIEDVKTEIANSKPAPK
jgi:hypothetical protein